MLKCQRWCVSLKYESEKSEIWSADWKLILLQCCFSQWERYASLVCVQGSVRVPTHHWYGRLLFHTVLKKRKEKTFLYNPTGTGSVQVLTHKHQIEKLSTLSALLFLVCSCISSAGEIKPDNILEQSLHFYFTDLLLRRWVGGKKIVRGWWKQRDRAGGRESNNYFVKTFVFSEKEPVHFMLRVLQLCLVAPLWMCSAVPQDVGFRKPFFL